MSHQRSALFTILLILLLPLGAMAADLDPLLQRFAAEKQNKAAGEFRTHYWEKLLVIEETGDKSDPRVAVILEMDGLGADLAAVPGLTVGSRTGNIVTARLPLSSLADLARLEGVGRVEAARMQYPFLDMAVPAANVDQAWAGTPAYTGEGVLVGVIDSGVDWRHEDFDNADGSTRIKAIWDLHATGTPPTGFNYGAEYTEAMINAGTAGEADYNGHGTHVTGMAAGNGRASSGQYRGVAYEADILFAKSFDDASGGFPSDKTIDAINYLVQKAASLGQPIAINMSLGGHSGAHDGTSLQEQVVDQVSGEGVAICIAAGNEGESYIHDSAAANGGSMSYRIPTYTPNGGTGDDYAVLEIWVEQATSITVTTPGGTTCGPVSSGTGNQGFNTGDGVVVIDNASQGTNPSNGDQVIYIQLDDQTGNDLAAGDWTISFSGGTGEAHAWMIVSSMFTGFPNSNNSYSVGSPGNAAEAITVAAWKSRQTWPSSAGTQGYGGAWGEVAIGDKAPFSSIGPTRDGAQKPDISAPGMAIISCYSSDTNPVPEAALRLTGNDYFVTQGTSMACPFTCGVAALLFEKNNTLTAQQIKAALQDGATTDGYTGSVWNASFGMGKVDAVGALAAVTGGAANPDGDLDLDGETTILDVILLVNYILDPVSHPLTAEAAANANVNGDGLINALDLVRIVNFILGTDTPGKALADDPARFLVGAPFEQDGRWFVEATLSGLDVAAGQFALQLPAGGWDASGVALTDPAAGHVAARSVGTDNGQIRVLVYDLDNTLPAGGVTVRLPLADGVDASPGTPDVMGLLVADPTGQERAVEQETAAAVFGGRLSVSPNPMRGATTIRFSSLDPRPYTLSVYDLRGRLVRELETGLGQAQPAGLDWDGRDATGRALPSGVYFVRVNQGSEALTTKVVLSR